MYSIDAWSGSRFLQLIKRLFLFKRKGILIRTACLLIIPMVLLFLVVPKSGMTDAELGLKAVLYLLISICSLLLSFVFGIYHAGASFKQYNIRESAWVEITLPARQDEKFFAHFTVDAVLVPCIFLIATILAAAIPLLVSPNAFTEHFQLLRDNPDYLRLKDEMNQTAVITSIIVSLMRDMALFFTGSAVFKSHPFLLTSVICISLSILVSNLIFDTLKDNIDSFNILLWTSTGVNVLLTGIILFIGYYFFKKRSVP